MNEDAFGALEVFEDKLVLQMQGAPPDSLPSGWPTELALPRGGRLVSAADAAPLLGGFVWLWLFLARMVLAPLAPVVRLLTSSESSDGDGASSGDTSRGDDAGAPSSDGPGAIV